jgi:hypothetical protein
LNPSVEAAAAWGLDGESAAARLAAENAGRLPWSDPKASSKNVPVVTLSQPPAGRAARRTGPCFGRWPALARQGSTAAMAQTATLHDLPPCLPCRPSQNGRFMARNTLP